MAITYHYRCNYCKEEFEIQQSIKDEPLIMCGECGKPDLERVIHAGADFIIQQEPKTLGLLADRNNKKNGRFWREDKEKEVKDSKKKAKKYIGKLKEGAAPLKRDVNYKPFWRKGPIDTDLAKMTPAEKGKYIVTGKKSVVKKDE